MALTRVRRKSEVDSLRPDSLAHALYYAAGLVDAVLSGRSLTDAYGELLTRNRDWPDATRGAIRDLTWTTLRAYGRTAPIQHELLRKSPPPALNALLQVALLRLQQRPDSGYVTVDQAVKAAALLVPKLKGVVNGVLRNYLRRQHYFDRLCEADEVATFQHPAWWLEQLKQDYPQDWQSIAHAGNQHPPMSLRANCRKLTLADARGLLDRQGLEYRALSSGAIQLVRPISVAQIPGFADGMFSVQDGGAQCAALWLDPKPGDRVLDACAAPGGKAAHLLEHSNIRLLALDFDAARLATVRSNLARLGLNAATRRADARQLSTWWDGRPFDCVLADVPCSGSGVVRRHPDIKWLRRAGDITRFARQQREILDALWQTVASGGKMLYTTCSVFRQENIEQIEHFCRRHSDAERLSIDGQLHHQLLPCPEHDGFFYALLRKRD